jgi:hypothetical protein
MYTGPFAEIVEVDARLSYEDGRTERMALPARYEFRRYAFMLGHQRRGDLYQAFAEYLVTQLPPSSDAIELVVVRRVCKSPARTGFWGRFDIDTDCVFLDTVVARRRLH